MNTFKIYKNGSELKVNEIERFFIHFFGITENNTNYFTAYNSKEHGNCFHSVMSESFMELNIPIDYEIIQIRN